MKIDKTSFAHSNKKSQPLLNSKNTGYAATGSIALAVATGVSKNKSINKSHKFFAVLSAALVGIHIYSVEHFIKRYKKLISNNQ